MMKTEFNIKYNESNYFEMSEVLLHYLNKNTTNVIIDYLTPLPELPFLKELVIITRNLYADFNTCKYYQNYYYVSNKYLSTHKVKFYQSNDGWSIRWI